MRDVVREQPTECRQVADELLGTGANLVPDWVEDASDNHVERAEVRVVYRQVVQVELCVMLNGRWRTTQQRC